MSPVASCNDICPKREVRFGDAPLQRTRSDGQAFKPAREARALPRPETYSLHIRIRAFTVFGDEAVDPRGDNRQRYRAELEHGIVERADVEFRSERFLRLFAGTHDREPPGRAQALEAKRCAADAS